MCSYWKDVHGWFPVQDSTSSLLAKALKLIKTNHDQLSYKNLSFEPIIAILHKMLYRELVVHGTGLYVVIFFFF